MKRWVAAMAVAMACGARPAPAHQTADSRMEVHVRPEANEVDLLLMVPAADLAERLRLDADGDGRLGPRELESGEDRVTAYLRGASGARRGGEVCAPRGAPTVRLEASLTHLLFLDTLVCPVAGALTLHNAVLFETGPYQHLARIQVGDEVRTTVFIAGMSRYEVALGKAPGLLQVLARYGWHGVLHILLGLDHVLFVVCLVLVAMRLRRLVAIITAFTVAHTVTLVASALDWVTLPPSLVEPAIALSIVYVAVENIVLVRRKPETVEAPAHRYLLTFFFGLVHGFGFSYVLRDEVGLPTEALWPALLSFNVGVEVGQVAIVLLVWPGVRWLARGSRYPRVVGAVSALVAAVALYWLWQRITG